MNDPGVSISASLQLGSSFAIIFCFRNEISLIFNSLFAVFRHRKVFNDENTRFAIFISLASFPILIVGIFIKLFWPSYSDSDFRGLFSIAIVSIIMAILLALSEIYGKKKKVFSDIKIKDIIIPL